MILTKDQALKYRAIIEGGAELLPDNEAVTVKTLYDEWAENIPVVEGDRRYYPPTDKLYKCRKAHTTQADWTPDLAPDLWTPLDVEHAGTIDDPISAVSGMEYVKGKYYIESDVVYLMNREGMADGEAVVLHFLPSQLVGQYFEVVE